MRRMWCYSRIVTAIQHTLLSRVMYIVRSLSLFHTKSSRSTSLCRLPFSLYYLSPRSLRSPLFSLSSSTSSTTTTTTTTSSSFGVVRHYTNKRNPPDPRQVIIDLENVSKQNQTGSSGKGASSGQGKQTEYASAPKQERRSPTTQVSWKERFVNYIRQDSDRMFAIVSSALSVVVAYRLLRARNQYEEDTEHMRNAILLLNEALVGSPTSTQNENTYVPTHTLPQRLTDIRKARQRIAAILSSSPLLTSLNSTPNSKTITAATTATTTTTTTTPITTDSGAGDKSNSMCTTTNTTNLNNFLLFEVLRDTEQLLAREEHILTQQIRAAEYLVVLGNQHQRRLWVLPPLQSTLQQELSSSSSSPSSSPSAPVPVSTKSTTTTESIITMSTPTPHQKQPSGSEEGRVF